MKKAATKKIFLKKDVKRNATAAAIILGKKKKINK